MSAIESASRPVGAGSATKKHSRLLDAVEGLTPLVGSAKSVSFSQYGEDLLLAVSLLPRARGFYVDVGAYHPWKGSNTYKLYLRGWSGLTIEPNPDLTRDFRRKRPRDMHVVAGVAPTREELTYFRFEDAKLNTFSREQAQVYASEGCPALGETRVPCRPLQEIIDEMAQGTRIDLLSIDCEGFDLAALQTLDYARNRPTAVLVEDFGAFEGMKEGLGLSAIQQFMIGQEYAQVGQAMFSTLYVDRRALARKDSEAFNLAAVQFT